MNKTACFLVLLFLAANSYANAAKTYRQHCQVCHGKNRIGAMAPALLPENLKYLRKKAAFKTISEGRIATQMQGFKNKLGKQQIDELVDYIYTPGINIRWTEQDIRNSRKLLLKTNATLSDKPIFNADPLNLFTVVELGDHHASLVDGDKLEVIHRLKTPYAVHGGPKYSPDGRYIYFGSRDGWILKYDIYNLTPVAQVRAGINMRNIALSSDGRFLLAGNFLPHTLVLFNTKNLKLVKVIKAKDNKGNSSRVSAVYNAPPRHAFIAAFKDMAQIWEISYQHTPELNPFGIRKIKIDTPLDDFFFDQSYTEMIGSSRHGHAQVINLQTGKIIKRLQLKGMPHLSSGITWKYKGKTVLATPNLRKAQITIYDINTWEVIKNIPTKGSGFFLRSHKNSQYAWADVFFGKNRDLMQVIDKKSLKIIKTLKPAPGKTSAHVEFDRYGKYALVSIWDMDGAIVVYDAKTLKEIKRLPMKKPSGKYNVYNKIHYAEGTSH